MILELCAGYGGLGLAVERLTGERVGYVAEVDPAASLVLAERYPDAPNIGDIRDQDWSRFVGEVTVITAGFPCQDISDAGKREGITGERSGIVSHVLDAVRTIRPGLVFLENVSAIKARGLPVLVRELAEIGYDLRWVCVRASNAGLAHKRERWFGLATPAHTDR